MRVVPFWILLVAGCAGTASKAPEDRRRGEIRRLIKRNLHFNFHGFQKVVDERTGPGVRRHVTEADLPILASLLDPDVEPEHVIRLGAAATMTEFGEAARPYLLAADHDGFDAWLYLRDLDSKLKRKSAD